MVFTHDYRFRVGPDDVDSYGHVNNSNYLQILEKARWEWIAPWGGNRELVQRLSTGPIILEIKIRFLRELLLNDEIVIRSKREGDIGRIFEIHHEIINAQNELACRANFKMGFMNLQTRRLVEPPPLWREVFLGRKIDA